MQTDSHLDRAQLGRGPAELPDGGHLPTSVLISVEAAALTGISDPSRDICP
jgi:hypothetical protein